MQVSDAHVLIAANPKSGASCGRTKVAELRAALESAGLVVEVCESLELLGQRSGQLTACGRLRAVVSAGGDGTAAAVVNLIPVGVPMVILPLGTENLLAKYLGLSADIPSVASAVCDGRLLRLDAGLAGGRLFLVMLGCGFDAEVVQQLHAARQGHISQWTYSKPIWRAMRNYQYPLIEVECEPGSYCMADLAASSRVELSGAACSGGKRPGGDTPGTLVPDTLTPGALTPGALTPGALTPDTLIAGAQTSAAGGTATRASASGVPGDAAGAAGADCPLRFSTAWLFAFNLPRYAANLPFCPQADGGDGYLDLCSFARGGTLRGLSYLTYLWLGRHQRLSDFRHLKTKRFRLRSQGVVPYQIDGDPGGTLPLDVEVLPERLTVLVPKQALVPRQA